MMTASDIADVMNALGVDKNALTAIMSRAALLTQVSALQSKIANARSAKDKSNAAADAEIVGLQDALDKLQTQINAL